MTLTLDYLRSLSPDDTFGHTNAYMRGVHALPRSDFRTFVTDGRCALYLTAAVDGATPAVEKIIEAVGRVIDPCGLEHRLSLAGLREWLGEPVESETCKDCEGTGEVCCVRCEREGADCEQCGGGGEVQPQPREGVLCGLPIDRNRLAKWLRHLPGEAVVVTCDRQDRPLHIDGDGWRVAVQPLSQLQAKGASRYPAAGVAVEVQP